MMNEKTGHVMPAEGGWAGPSPRCQALEEPLHTLGTLPVGLSAHRLLRQRRGDTNLREPVHPPTEQLQPHKAARTAYLTKHWTRLRDYSKMHFALISTDLLSPFTRCPVGL